MELFDGMDYDGPLICLFFLLQRKNTTKTKINTDVETTPAIRPVKFWSCRISTFPITVDKTSCFHWKKKPERKKSVIILRQVRMRLLVLK